MQREGSSLSLNYNSERSLPEAPGRKLSEKVAVDEAKVSERKILVLTERGGQHGPFTDAGLEWLRALEGVEVTEINDTSPVDDDFLSRFDAVVQLDYPPYRWTTVAGRAFEKYIDQGRGGWVGFHHATLLGQFDGYPIWPWFRDFMGGVLFENYIAGLADGTVKVERRNHPVMRGVRSRFVVERDEWYTFDRSPRAGGVEVLATVDEESYSPLSEIRMGDHPAVWTNPAKRARNVYFLMGHTAELFDNQDFTRMFRNALEWTAKSD